MFSELTVLTARKMLTGSSVSCALAQGGDAQALSILSHRVSLTQGAVMTQACLLSFRV